jgi:(2Fe-2S) ferredoxin
MTAEEGAALEPGDVVQITKPERHWYPALLIVEEVKPWGVQAYCLIPEKNTGPASVAYTRLKWEEIERVGRAILIGGAGTS